MRARLNGVAAAYLVLLAGCAMGPDYHAPQIDAPGQWVSPLAGGETNLPPAEAAWWKSFRDPELDSLIYRAAQSNLNLRVAEARVREARAARGVAAADFGPTIDAAASYTSVRLSKNGFPQFPPGIALGDNVYQVGFDAAWELDVFGGTRRAVEAASAEIRAAEYDRRDVLVSLLGEVARNYVDVRGCQRRLTIAHQNIDAQENILVVTQDRFRNGLTDDLDVQRAATVLSTTQAQVPVLESGLKASIYQLGVLLAQPPGALMEELSTDAPIPGTPPEVPVGLPSELLLRRPDIRRAERELAAATARIGVAKADLFPKFSLTGAPGLQSISVSDWFTAGSRFWAAGPTVQWRIFDTGRIRSNIRVQNARQEGALAAYENTVLASFEDVESALVAYAKEQIRHRSLAEAARTSADALRQSSDLYTNGLSSFLDVLDAERTLYQAQDDLAQSDKAVSQDLIVLYKALGGGWERETRSTTLTSKPR